MSAISRQQLYAAGEPFGDSCSRIEGGRRIYGGGGDSGGGQTYYANQDKLLGVQADIAQGIYNDIYAPNATGAVKGLSKMVDQANDGTMTTQARATAAADAGAATGQALDASNRNLARYGLNPNKFGADSTTIALGAAATKTDAMNRAQQWGEGQKWGRTYDFYNSLSGIPSQTSASLGSAASGYGSMGRASTDVDIANAQGQGRMGGMIGSALLRKDGGIVRAPRKTPVRMKKGGKCMAQGGLMRLPNWREQSTAGSRYATTSSNPIANIIGSAATTYGVGKASSMAKEGLHQAFRSATSQAPAPVATANPVPAAQITDAATQSGNAAAANASNAESANVASDVWGTEGLGTTAGEALATEGTAAAAGETAAAAGESAAATTAAGEVAATNAWNPVGWAAAIYGAGSLAGWWQKGGIVHRQDKRGGGAVSGPGGPTEDKVPAWLSDGEYVLNAKATQMVGVKKLDKINKEGLRARGDVGKRNKPGKRGMGGLWGVALGAAADEYDRQRNMDRADRADARSAQLHDLNIKNAQMAQEDLVKNRNDLRQIREAGDKFDSGIAPGSPVSNGPSAPVATPAPDQQGVFAAPQATPAPAPDSSPGVSGESQGLTRSNDTLGADKLFRKQRAMYEKSLELNRPDLAGQFYSALRQTRDGLMNDAMNRADRMYYASNRTNLAGYIDAYNKYVMDGQDVVSHKPKEDGSVEVNFGANGGVQTFPKDKVPELIMALKNPGVIQQLETDRAKKVFELHAKTQEELNKPVKVGKDETVVIPATGQQFKPDGSSRMDPKEYNSTLDDINSMILNREANFSQLTGKWNTSPATVAKQALAAQIFRGNTRLTPAEVVEIADKGQKGTAKVLQNGQHVSVPAMQFNGKWYPLVGESPGMTQSPDYRGAIPNTPENLSAAGADAPARASAQPIAPTRSVSGIIRRPDPAQPQDQAPAKPAASPARSPAPSSGNPGISRVSSNRTDPTFPRMSPEAEKDMGRIRVMEAGGIEGARKNVAAIEKELKRKDLDGTQRSILEQEKARIESGIAELSRRG